MTKQIETRSRANSSVHAAAQWVVTQSGVAYFGASVISDGSVRTARLQSPAKAYLAVASLKRSAEALLHPKTLGQSAEDNPGCVRDDAKAA